MVGIVSDVARVSLKGLARSVGESVPDRWLPSVLIDGTFNLIRSRGTAPQKVGWEPQQLRAGQRPRHPRERSAGKGGCAGQSLAESTTRKRFHLAIRLPLVWV